MDHPMVGGAVTGGLCLGCMRKAATQKPEKGPIGRVPPWFLLCYCHQVFSWLLFMMDYNLSVKSTLFSSQLLLASITASYSEPSDVFGIMIARLLETSMMLMFSVGWPRLGGRTENFRKHEVHLEGWLLSRGHSEKWSQFTWKSS